MFILCRFTGTHVQRGVTVAILGDMARIVEISILTMGVLLVALLLTPCAEAFAADACDESCCIACGQHETETCTVARMTACGAARAIVPNEGRTQVVGLAPWQPVREPLTSSKSVGGQHSVPLRV